MSLLAGAWPAPAREAPEPDPAPSSSPAAPSLRDSATAVGVSSGDTVSFAFLLPAEGDVFHATTARLVVRVGGPMPEGVLAVLDGVPREEPLRGENGVLGLTLTGLTEGVHVVRLLYLDARGRLRSTRSTRFFVRLPEPPPPPLPPRLKQFGRVTARAEWRNEEAATRLHSQAPLRGLATVPETDSTYAYDTLLVGRAERPLSRHVNATIDGSYSVRFERWEADVKATASTQENRFRQPVNRFSAQAAYGPWAQLTVGDVHPEYNPLIFNGARVRGVEAGGALVLGEEETRWLYARATTGETRRTVPAYIIRSRFGAAYDTAYVPGTRAQRMTAVRVGVGGGSAFDAGVTLMKASSAREDSVAEEVNRYLYGPAPSENLVGGFDARLGLWEGKLALYARSALSLYTRDRSLGAFASDTSGAAFDPARYRRIFVVNPTTSGWEYLVSDDVTSPDYSGFLRAASAYTAGVSASFPWKGVVWETDLGYDHLGAAYHSEGNLFLGGDPGGGWTLRQGWGLWENMVYAGAEASRFERDFGDHRQSDRGARAELRVSPPGEVASAWIDAGITRSRPRGPAEFRYEQDFDELNAGLTRTMNRAAGTWTVFAQYGLTRARFRVVDPVPGDPTYPVSVTHAVTSSVLYKFRDSDFIPKLTHAYADNGLHKPAHTLGVGAQKSVLERRIRLDGNAQVNEYARTPRRNGLGWGQNAAVTLRLRERETWKLTERASWQGTRVSIIAGSHYERSF